MTRVLTGIKPTGSPHFGNYLGAILPALKRAESAEESFFFIADMHALNQIQDPELFQKLSYSITATWLSAGLDPNKSFFYKQSDIPEDFELATILNSFTPKGWMNKSHAYKAAVDKNSQDNKDPDNAVSMGLYTYPILMAADILIFNADTVPVGPDQVQHVEIARDIAERFNNQYGSETLTLPSHELSKTTSIPGTDGRKMSKSYDNVIPLFASKSVWKKAVYSIVTDSSERYDPKDLTNAPLFDIYTALANEEQTTNIKEKLEKGELGWGDAKSELLKLITEGFSEKSEKYSHYMNNTSLLDEILHEGAKKARPYAQETLQNVRTAIGIKKSVNT